jgi:hypothetical protein
MTRKVRGHTLHIEVNNPNGVSKGISSLTIDGVLIEGNLIPIARLKDGAKISATLS